MKRRIYQVSFSVVVALLLTMTAGVYAQSSARLVADIPFDFHVGKATLPSGQYMVKSGSPNSGSLSIQSKDGSSSAMALTMAVAPSKNDGTAKLVFNRYGSDYFLSQVWNPDESIVRGLSKTKAETEIARKSGNAHTTLVALKK